MRGQWIHKNGHVPPSLRAVGYALSQLGLDQFQPSKLEVSSAGKSSISMGHLYHGYVTNNQRVYYVI